MSTDLVSTDEMLYQQQCIHQLQAESGLRYFHIITFGCQQNENDSEKLSGILEQAGLTAIADYRKADLVILNTCSVRENADDRLFGHLGLMKNLRRDRRGVLIGLCGCMMTQDVHLSKVRKSYPFVDFIFGPQDIHLLPGLLADRLFSDKKTYLTGSADRIAEDIPMVRSRKFRALTTIMYGCNNFCSYCIVPYTRGRERSRHPDKILEEIRTLVADGFREIMLLGQNVNSYGRDLPQSEGGIWNFAKLLEAIAQVPNLYRVRFMTSHPKDLSDELIRVIAANPNIERHLHLPLQSGSSKILKDMNRQYDRDHYLGIIERIRARIPEISLSTDIIVGYPGETDADFQDTLDLMSAVRFDSAFTFQYSRRMGTPAANREDQVTAEVVKERFGRLLALQNTHSLAANEAQVGRHVEVLIEGASETAPDILTGRGTDFRLINFRISDESVLTRDQDLEGRVAIVKIIKAKTFSLEGELERLIG